MSDPHLWFQLGAHKDIYVVGGISPWYALWLLDWARQFLGSDGVPKHAELIQFSGFAL